MSSEDTELLREFVVESQDHLANVETQLLTLEEQGDNMDVGLVNTVFRAVHSIKGAAGFLGLNVLERLAHREEEVLNRLRNRDLRPTPEVINVLLKSSDQLKTLLENIDSSNEQDISSYISALEKLLNDGSDWTSLDNVVADAPDALSAEALREFLVESFDNLEQLELDLVSLEKLGANDAIINGAFRSIHSIKGTSGFLGFAKIESITHAAEDLLGSIRGGTTVISDQITSSLFAVIDRVRTYLKSIEASGSEGETDSNLIVERLVKLQEVERNDTSSRRTALKDNDLQCAKQIKPERNCPVATEESRSSKQVNQTQDSAPTANLGASVVELSTLPKVTASNSEVSKPNADASVADSSIRVDVALLDKLMTCVGELVLARNQILQFASSNANFELHATTQRLNLITTELQEGVMKTRMQPIGNVWGKFPRLVRDLAVICEKQVRIEMEGKETELDKTIIESIKDPLTHLVRNTVDHGIEKPEVRLQKGKPAEGCLTLRAFHEGGQVNIEICDDGAGLNIDRIRAKAIEKNLISQEQASSLNERDAAQLIFLPGFSTAEKVSNVSGRGVGMDVVKTNIEKIGGTVDLTTCLDEGTTIKIKIPLTLAIIPALIVSNDGNRYAIPQVSLLELVRLDRGNSHSQIEWIHGAPVYRLRGRLLPLIYLCDVLNGSVSRSTDCQEGALNIVVLRADDRQFGLVVDRINDTEEIVVKPLSKQLKGIPVYAGTTIMGDGKVALILDVYGLAHCGHVISQNQGRGLGDHYDRSAMTISENRSLLIVGAGRANRYAIPLSEVTRLEKINSKSIEISSRQEVVQYRGNILPLVRLSTALGIEDGREHASTDVLNVIVYSEKGQSIGVVVGQIHDVVTTATKFSRVTQRYGLLGNAVINNHVTDLLNLPDIIHQLDSALTLETQC